jgi:hypothetical protein
VKSRSERVIIRSNASKLKASVVVVPPVVVAWVSSAPRAE